MYREFTYCWEEIPIAKLALQRAIKIAGETEELFVIGYSFPYVNRPFDDQIFEAMTKLNRIVIQDPYMKLFNFNEIKSRLQDIIPTSPEVLLSEEGEEFILPR